MTAANITVRIDDHSATAQKSAQSAAPSTARRGPTPRPLSYWRTRLTQTDGKIPGPDGTELAVSLDDYRDHDPDSTMLAIYVQWVDSDLAGTKASP